MLWRSIEGGEERGALARLWPLALIGCTLSGLGSAPAVQAQRAIDVQTFEPPAGRTVAVAIPDPELPAHTTLIAGLWTSWARRPLMRYGECALSGAAAEERCPAEARDQPQAVVSDLADLQVGLAGSFYDALQLGAVLPIAYVRAVDDIAQPSEYQTRVALGDLRLSIDVPLLQDDTAVALRLLASLPTGDELSFVGGRNWSALPMVVARQRIDAFALAASAGYRVRQRTGLFGLEYDDELDLALGASYAALRALAFHVELRARVGLLGETQHANESPVEALLSASLQAASGTSVVLGAGTGVWPGRAGYGAPLVRVFASVRQSFEPSPCAFGPEDRDGFRDGDYCGDPDNDADGLLDRDDACPNDAEDKDGFADADGCPDFDDDADGLPDALDHCPRRSEDRDGFEDADGCPELDNDADGLADVVDACAMDPEDADAFEDADGCPEPGPRPVSISVGEERILVSERIYFEYDRDTLRSVSAPLLDQLAQVIRAVPTGIKVVVEGHTDESGNAAYNLDLSYRRAQAVVEYLKARGVPGERLEAAGKGADAPLGPNDSQEGRALNRRVEFLLRR